MTAKDLMDAGQLGPAVARLSEDVRARPADRTARTFLFSGHIPQLFPFLVTRQVFAGPGWLSPDGRFLLSARATALERPIGAYTYGRGRPVVDVKEFFFFRPFGFR